LPEFLNSAHFPIHSPEQMAHTARSKEEEEEIFDSPEELEQKVGKLAALISSNSHVIAFTGAGISTSCGIPDYRSSLDTCLATGPGSWALAAAKQKRTKKFTGPLRAIPSITHMSLVQLQRAGMLQHVVSQNTDGLHRRSGLPRSALSELHGNSNLEYCLDCGNEYMRDFRTRAKDADVRGGKGALFHLTGRLCKCGGKLRDSIVNFTESLPRQTLATAEKQGKKAGLCLVLGSSCTVTPAADVPPLAQKMVVVNLQRTPLDSDSNMALRIHAKTDDVMKLLMEKLAQPIPHFVLERRIKVTVMQQLKTISTTASVEAGSTTSTSTSSTSTTTTTTTTSSSSTTTNGPQAKICRSTITIAGVDADDDEEEDSVTPYELFRRVNVLVPELAGLQGSTGVQDSATAGSNADDADVQVLAERTCGHLNTILQEQTVTKGPKDSSTCPKASVAPESSIIAVNAALAGPSLVPNKRGRYRIDTDPGVLHVVHQLPVDVTMVSLP
jgi:NAD-dependent SIR2 family protein deacetylase